MPERHQFVFAAWQVRSVLCIELAMSKADFCYLHKPLSPFHMNRHFVTLHWMHRKMRQWRESLMTWRVVESSGEGQSDAVQGTNPPESLCGGSKCDEVRSEETYMNAVLFNIRYKHSIISLSDSLTPQSSAHVQMISLQWSSLIQ